MLISVAQLEERFGVHPRGVLHVGAHEAEEAEAYQFFGWGPVIWVEMLEHKYLELCSKFDGDENNKVLHAACWDIDDIIIKPHIASNNQSTSLLKPKKHLSTHPEISFNIGNEIRTSRLDTILSNSVNFEFVNLDIQGAELNAMKGLGDRLKQVKWLYLEVNLEELYKGCPLLADIDYFLNSCGFSRVAKQMSGVAIWGDALYVNVRYFTWDQIIEMRLIGEVNEVYI